MKTQRVGKNHGAFDKKNVTLIKNWCAAIRNAPHFYGLPLDLCGKRIVALFATKHAAIFANVPQLSEFPREKRRNPRILALYKTAHSGIASKCGAHGGITAGHGTLRLSVLPRLVCWILFDVYHMCIHLHTL